MLFQQSHHLKPVVYQKLKGEFIMSKAIKSVAIVLLLGVLLFHYHNEIQEFINSLPFSIPFLTEEKEIQDKGSFEYYFKNNNIHEEPHEENVWDIYKN